MNIAITLGPGNSVAEVTLLPNEVLTSEGGAMVSMHGVTINTTTHKKNRGGVLKALKRMISGEGFFMNHFTAGVEGGEVLLATSLPGDMAVMDLDDEKIIVQSGSYVASSEGVDFDFGWEGMKSFFSGESAFWIHASGTGKLVINAFGAIYPIEVDGEYIVDTGHIVAFQETLDFSITKAGRSWISSMLGGEGLVCKFKGKGTVWCQSHNVHSFGSALAPHLKPVNR